MSEPVSRVYQVRLYAVGDQAALGVVTRLFSTREKAAAFLARRDVEVRPGIRDGYAWYFAYLDGLLIEGGRSPDAARRYAAGVLERGHVEAVEVW